MAKTQSDGDTVIDSADVAGNMTDAGNEPVNTLGHYLVVRHAFGEYRKGDAIRDEVTIKAVLNGENARSVHKVIG
ncbi:MAG: hypothetical protein WCA85_25740 [Paraburkholderia sp.]|uniref:hypothetical protein n=1 Tax=Paraburkholderia sp. TaxID=1926495 RepID=UPI003C3CBCEC